MDSFIDEASQVQTGRDISAKHLSKVSFYIPDSRIYPLNSLRSQGSFLENAPLYKC